MKRQVVGAERPQAGVHAQDPQLAQHGEEARRAPGHGRGDVEIDLDVEAAVLAAASQQRRPAGRRLDHHRDLEAVAVRLDGRHVPGLAQLSPEPHRGALHHEDLALARRHRDVEPRRRQHRRRPHARGDHDRAGRDPAARGADRRRAPVAAALDALDGRPLDEAHTRSSRRPHQRRRREPWLELGIARIEHAAGQVGRAVRLLLAQGRGVEDLAGDPEGGERRGALAHGSQLRLRLGHDHAALAVVLEVVGQLAGQRAPELGRADRERQLAPQLLVPGEHVPLAGAGAPGAGMGALVQVDTRARAREEVGAGRADDPGADHDDVRAPGSAEGCHGTLNPTAAPHRPPPFNCCEMGYVRLRDV